MDVMFVQNGARITYVPTADVLAGDVVVQGVLVGVARQDIRANTQGYLWIVGIFDFPKATGAGTAFSAGVEVFWDDTNNVAVLTNGFGANELIGKAIHKALDADSFVRVKMQQ